MVNRSEFDSDEEYEVMRQKIIDGLLQIEDHGQPIMIWVKRREEIYEGAKVENYPDIVYRMKPEYGVDRGLYGKNCLELMQCMKYSQEVTNSSALSWVIGMM